MLKKQMTKLCSVPVIHHMQRAQAVVGEIQQWQSLCCMDFWVAELEL